MKVHKLKVFRPEVEIETNSRILAWFALATHRVFYPRVSAIRLTMKINGKETPVGKIKMIVWPRFKITHA